MNVSDRPATRRRIIEVLTDAVGLESVQVAYSYPAAATRNEAIWLGDVTGAQDTVSIGSPRPGRDDTWTIDLVVAVTARPSVVDADARCQEILTAVCEQLFTSPGLAMAGTQLHPAGLVGPNGWQPPKEPASSVAVLTLSLRTAIRGAAT